MIFLCSPWSTTLNKHKKMYQHKLLSTVCVLNPILWFISLYNFSATVSHAERQNYQKKFCFLCVTCLFLRIKSVWNFFSSRVRAKIFCVSPERSQAWAGHSQKYLARWTMRSCSIFPCRIPGIGMLQSSGQPSQQKNMSVRSRALSWTRASASKNRQAGTKAGIAGKPKICFSPPAAFQQSNSLCSVKKKREAKAFSPLGSLLKSQQKQLIRTTSHIHSKKKSYLSRRQSRSVFIRLLLRLFPGKKSFPRLWAVFCQGKREACPRFKTAATRLLNALIGAIRRMRRILPARRSSGRRQK